MKRMICLLAALHMANICHADLTPDEIVRTIINWEGAVAYNPTNNSSAETTKADAVNAELRLKTLILQSSNEELRICYALKVINGIINSTESQMKDALPDVRPKLQQRLLGLLTNRKLLVEDLMAYQKRSNQAMPQRP